GRKFLHPGPGYGGSCFPKDTRALATVADRLGVETPIVGGVSDANEMQRLAMIQKIEKLVGNLQGTRIGILGLSFKPETD
ncbi:UDP-glucose 6-dehydrogenase, partial [Vibrio parahaemolyticus]|nr:UDP-glucose 6-dehydrogenase [Vibrio parahaemolyticus]